MALVSGRVWRRLVPMSAEMRILGGLHFGGVARAGTAVIGSELFLAGGMKQNSTYAGVSVYDAVDDEWFTIPLSSAYPQGARRELFAVGCAGRLYVGGLCRDDHEWRILLQSFDPDAQRWVDMPPMPPPLPVAESGLGHQLVAVAVGSEIYVLDRMEPDFFRVFDAATQTWSVVDIPEEVEIVDLLNFYKNKNKLSADLIGRGGPWLDTGSIEDFYKTSAFVSAIENRQGFKIACLEEISFNKKWINKKHIINSIKFYRNCEYSNHLKKLIN